MGYYTLYIDMNIKPHWNSEWRKDGFLVIFAI